MTAIEDRITEVLLQHRPYEAIDGNLYCNNHDCRPTTTEEVEAWDWAAHVAAAVVAELQLTEETRADGVRSGGITHFPRTVARRWVTGWENAE